MLGCRLVHAQWIYDSISSGKRLSLAEYQLPAGYSALHSRYIVPEAYPPAAQGLFRGFISTIEAITTNSSVCFQPPCLHYARCSSSWFSGPAGESNAGVIWCGHCRARSPCHSDPLHSSPSIAQEDAGCRPDSREPLRVLRGLWQIQ